MKTAIDTVLETYLKAYRGLIAVERLDQSTVLSFPMHLAASHRIEITVTDWGKGRFVISDSARTIGEIVAAGYSVTRQMRERLDNLASGIGAQIVDTHLILQTSQTDLGESIQKFLELSKTLGDVYLVHKQREKPDNDLIQEVGNILSANGLHYRQHEKINGRLEIHSLDMVVPPNGHPGLAVGILSGHNTHGIAGFWYYKCDDIKEGEWYQNAKARLALVYDVRSDSWSDTSRSILELKADIAVPSDSLKELSKRLKLG